MSSKVIDELLTHLSSMKQHAERERHAVRKLQSRSLFELAAEGETQARKLGQLLARVPKDVVGTPRWAEVMSRAAEVRAIARANAELMRRSLEVVRAAKQSGFVSPDAPAFVSRVA